MGEGKEKRCFFESWAFPCHMFSRKQGDRPPPQLLLTAGGASKTETPSVIVLCRGVMMARFSEQHRRAHRGVGLARDTRQQRRLIGADEREELMPSGGQSRNELISARLLVRRWPAKGTLQRRWTSTWAGGRLDPQPDTSPRPRVLIMDAPPPPRRVTCAEMAQRVKRCIYNMAHIAQEARPSLHPLGTAYRRRRRRRRRAGMGTREAGINLRSRKLSFEFAPKAFLATTTRP